MDEGQLKSKLQQAQTDRKILEELETLSLPYKKQALLIAVQYQLYKVVIYLLDHGVDVNYVDDCQNNPIHLLLYSYRRYDHAGRSDLLQCVVKLIDAGVDVNQANQYNVTPIHIAAKKRWYEIVIYLLEHGGYVHNVDGYQENLLYTLLFNYNRSDKMGERDLLQCVVKVVEAGVDVNQGNGDTLTHLFIAAMQASCDVLIYLLEHGVDVHKVDRDQNNLLCILLYYYNMSGNISKSDLLQCVIKLVEAGIDVNQVNVYEETPIVMAARKGLYEVVIYLSEHGANVQYVYRHTDNLLHILLDYYNRFDKTGKRDLLQCVVKAVEAGVDVNQANGAKETPIVIAAKKQMYEVVMYLLEHGGDVHYVNRRRSNLLHILISCHCSVDNRDLLQCVVKIVEAGVNVNQVNEYKVTPIVIAARRRLYEVVTYLLEHGGDVHDIDGCQENLLYILLFNYNRSDKMGKRDLLQCVVKVVEAGVDVNQGNADTMTPIFIAAMRGSYDVVKYLLEHGIDVHYVDRHQNNLLCILLDNYDKPASVFKSDPHNKKERSDLLQCIFKVVEAGVNVNQVNANKETPIVIAARKGFYNVLECLLEHGGDVHFVYGYQKNVLHILLDYYDSFDKIGKSDLLQCVVKVVEAGIDVNQVNEDKETPTVIAARKGFYDVVECLLKHGIDVQFVDSRQENLMHILLNSYTIDPYNMMYNKPWRRELLHCIVILVNAGVDVNQLNEHNLPPLVIAAGQGLFEVVIYLLEHGTNLHYVHGHQDNLLHILLYCYGKFDNICEGDMLQCVVKVVEAGVDVNHVNSDEETSIVIAARRRLYEVVIYLLEHGAHVQYVNSRRENLLFIILYYYNRYHNDKTSRRDLLQCVDKLIDAGVDVNQLNHYNKTPIVVAASKGLYEVVVYLLEHGVDVHNADSRQNNLLYTLIDNYVNPDTRDLVLQCVIKLVDAGVDVNQVAVDELPLVFRTAGKGLYEVVMYLLDHGVDVHYVAWCNCNILHYVLGCMYSNITEEENYVQLVNALIKTGVDINQPDYKGNTPLFYVGINEPNGHEHQPFSITMDQRNALEIPPFNKGKACGIKLKLKTGRDILVQLQCKLINMLLDAGCSVNHQNTKGQTPLMHHIRHQADISILKLLIPHSDLSLTGKKSDTTISYCVQYHLINTTAIFKLLQDSGSDLMSSNNGFRLFHFILNCKRLGLFSYYIRRKLIVNGVTAEGENMLHLLACVNYDYSAKFKWLLNNELDINLPCSKTNTPTMIAAFLLNSKYLDLLTRHPRLDINSQNNKGHTALHLCIIGFTIFKDGLNKRQVNDVVNNYCRKIYPIYMACIDSLLGVDGIDVNIPDRGGRTCLMMAAMKNDRVLIRKLLYAGAIVNKLDCAGRSAIQYLDIYQSVFDLTCFKLLLSNADTGLLNIPCIDGNTIVQTALCFPFFWEPCRVFGFIRYLVAENCCLQILTTSSVESSYNQIDLKELSLQERKKLRKLLYLSGAQGEEITTSINFDKEDERYEQTEPFHPRGREQFIDFCRNISLKSLCRRIIRQNLGLGIQRKVNDVELPRELNDFLLLKDVLHPQHYNLDHIDDGYKDFDDDDDYVGYDMDKDRDGDYSEYNYQYVTLNTDHEHRQVFLNTWMFPNGDDKIIYNLYDS